MAEYIERAPLLEAFKAKHCEDCPGGYARTKCKTWCDAADDIALVEDAPEVSPYAMCWRKTSENPPTKEDAEKADSFVLSVYYSEFYKKWRICQQTWELVVALQDEYPFWMPLPGLPEALR